MRMGRGWDVRGERMGARMGCERGLRRARVGVREGRD